MIVYRVENDRGTGPYCFNMGEWCEGPHNLTTGRPMPIDDGMDNLNYDIHRFGFASMIDLLNWFTTTELKALYSAGSAS